MWCHNGPDCPIRYTTALGAIKVTHFQILKASQQEELHTIRTPDRTLSVFHVSPTAPHLKREKCLLLGIFVFTLAKIFTVPRLDPFPHGVCAEQRGDRSAGGGVTSHWLTQVTSAGCPQTCYMATHLIIKLR